MGGGEGEKGSKFNDLKPTVEIKVGKKKGHVKKTETRDVIQNTRKKKKK